MEQMQYLRKEQLKDKINNYIVVGLRDLGISINEMEEFLSRLKVNKIPGIIGYVFNKGDEKALKNAQSLTNQILKL